MKRIIRAGMAALAAVALLGGGAARADKPLTLGVSVGLGNVAMEIAVREARAQGWTSSWWSFPTTSARTRA